MTVRLRITLLVAGAGFLAALLFSVVVFLELAEQPFDILDAELEEVADTWVRANATGPAGSTSPSADPDGFDIGHYWLRTYDRESKETVSRTPLAGIMELPSVNPGSSKTATVVVPGDRFGTVQDAHHEVTFRIRTFARTVDGRNLSIQVARSIEKLEEEMRELLLGLGAGLTFSVIALLAVSYFVSGRILKPVGELNDLARNIGERNLAQRIPVGVERDEFSELSRTVNHMLDRLQFSFTRQKQYLGDASHELNSPLTMLKLFFEEATQWENLPEAFKKQLATQEHTVLRMDRLVKALLELSVLEIKSSLNLERFDLPDLVRSVLEDFAPLVQKTHIQLENDLPRHFGMQGDRDKIRRAFINILDNAVKYNVEDGWIRLTIEEKNDGIHLCLSNSGPGIPKEDLEGVFEQFYRVEKSRSVKYGGAGLGLAIVREIIRLHKGTVSIDSAPGEWTRVDIVLPLCPQGRTGKAQNATIREPPTALPAPHSRPRIE